MRQGPPCLGGVGSIPFQASGPGGKGLTSRVAAKSDRVCQGQRLPLCPALGRARVSGQQTLAHDVGAGISHSVLSSVCRAHLAGHRNLFLVVPKVQVQNAGHRFSQISCLAAPSGHSALLLQPSLGSKADNDRLRIANFY